LRGRTYHIAAVALALLLPVQGWPADETTKVAVFDFELIDTSLEGEVYGPRPDERQRLVLIGDLLRRMLADSNRYAVLDLSPLAAEISEAGHLYGCNGCATRIAAALGAEEAITGTVQKVSNFILNVNLYVWDVQTGSKVRVWSVDVRGNTDESWSRGVSYIVRNRLLPDTRK
jgi:hypothetical protein